MNYSYLVPNWFFGFDIAMELIFAIVTVAISVFAIKVYKISEERKTKILGFAFAFIGLSYFIWALSNIWFVGAAYEGFREISLHQFVLIDLVTAYAFMGLFILGLSLIVYISCDLKDLKSFALIFGLSLMVIAASTYKLTTFRILSVFLLLFIVMKYINEYTQNKNKNTLGVLLAFTLLLLGSADFVFSSIYYQTYVIGHFLELSAYILLLRVLIKSANK